MSKLLYGILTLVFLLPLIEAISWQSGNWANGCDFNGGDKANSRVSSQNCGGTCAARSDCTHFTWTNFNGGTCWMKGGYVKKSDASSTNDNSMVCGIVANNINWQSGNWAFACDFNGGDISNAQVSGSNCGSKCASTSGCTHFTWTNFNGGTCWMKGGSVSKSNAFYTDDYSAVCGISGTPSPPGPPPPPPPPGTTPPPGQGFGSINVDGVGTMSVIGRGNVKVSNNGFTLTGDSRVYFADKAGKLGDPFVYWQAKLLGKKFSYEIDVSNVGCHCNAAVYFSQLPGYGSNQQLFPGDGDYYCDANKVNGNYCPEYDIFEGNKYTMQSTLHSCNYVAPHYFPSCDSGGCPANAFSINPKLMCPDSSCIINTNSPFTVTHTQSVAGDGTMNNVNVWFGQGGKSTNFNVCPGGDYPKNMGYSLNGIVFVASLWGGPGIDMNWLDGKTGCSGTCNIGGSSVTMRNFSLK